MLLTKTDKEEYDKMLTSALKRILNVPTSTPNYNILIETGYLPITQMIEKRRIMYENAKLIDENHKDTWVQDIIKNGEHQWNLENKLIREKLNIEEDRYKK